MSNNFSIFRRLREKAVNDAITKANKDGVDSSMIQERHNLDMRMLDVLGNRINGLTDTQKIRLEEKAISFGNASDLTYMYDSINSSIDIYEVENNLKSKERETIEAIKPVENDISIQKKDTEEMLNRVDRELKSDVESKTVHTKKETELTSEEILNEYVRKLESKEKRHVASTGIFNNKPSSYDEEYNIFNTGVNDDEENKIIMDSVVDVLIKRYVNIK